MFARISKHADFQDTRSGSAVSSVQDVVFVNETRPYLNYSGTFGIKTYGNLLAKQECAILIVSTTASGERLTALRCCNCQLEQL